jgi:hypothetical protein
MTSTFGNMCVYAYRSADTPEHRDWQIIQDYSLIVPRITESRPTSTSTHIIPPPRVTDQILKSHFEVIFKF